MLMEVFNAARMTVWRQQPDSFFEEAVIDADGYAELPEDEVAERFEQVLADFAARAHNGEA